MKYVAILFIFFPFFASAFDQLVFNQLDLDLQLISSCESGFRDVTVLDVNSEYSYSHFQWQIASFEHYGKKYGILPQELTRKEALIFVHNPWVTAAVARATIDDVGYYPWTNCARKTGLI